MILIRADGNKTIGLGHIMRCLSIAVALRKAHEKVMFVTADDCCGDLIRQRGFEIEVLNSSFFDMESELDSLVSVIERYNPTSIIVDSYYVTEKYLCAVSEKTKTIYIDDIMSFAYPVDVLINYNIFSSLSDYKKLYADCINIPQLLLGTQYVPLREEFSGLVPNEQPNIARRVLISTGGADSQHVTIKLLEYIILHKETFNEFHFTFIIGAANQDKDKIIELSASIPQVEIVYNVQNMSNIMLENDVAISAAGSTLYELCACGVPTITYVLADNQIPAAESFSKKHIMLNIGDIRKQTNPVSYVFSYLLKLCENKQMRDDMRIKSQFVVDGFGASRIVDFVINTSTC